MKIESYLKAAPWLSLAGVLFAGYLTSIKLFGGACAFNETCPTLWGLPSCAYGFVIFSALFLVSLYANLKRVRTSWPIKVNLTLSGFGILFAGWFAVPEIISILSGGPFYTLGLPTCVYGLVFYILIFIVTTVAWNGHRKFDVPPIVTPSL
ncbi:hypothetical protein COY93_04595 [Candidatus Uhrbacteria bacterium CG_4_10_14_0_8_um_filter_58_22]|uniref:Vitamin K epoxide reductase domain-containing protein n=1 Tax=Candidatus Uhrbacteria bacterium CG_4_10_14_0_8_um_filter_58_22 TaxID=1975029 RepID=A0A2M7Q9V1_9BACT|nr:MAG: hypothetical protein AUJ19_01860 [Parcubacteria group bacterium CG1_02_58_44]PIY61914.1 MAG: hypothetical protein COY93_04595 [Candidatus Uhrbacteria bacterium CG_4_10_14_0_8_um_filter_58_22]